MALKVRTASIKRNSSLQIKSRTRATHPVTQSERTITTTTALKKSSNGAPMTKRVSEMTKVSYHKPLEIKNNLLGTNTNFNAVEFFNSFHTTTTKNAQVHAHQQHREEKTQPPKFIQRPVLLQEEVATEHIRFGMVKKHTTGGGQYVPLTYGPNDRPLRIQTPPVRIPFGMKAFEGASTIQLAISLDNLRTDKEMKGFHDLLSKIDEKVVNIALKESKPWFKRELPADVVKANYRPSLKFSDKGEFAPLLNLKIPIDKKHQRPAIEVYSNHDLAPSELLTNRGGKIIAIIEPRSIWFLGGATFGISWIVLQAKVLETGGSSRLVGYGFVEDALEDVDEIPTETEAEERE